MGNKLRPETDVMRTTYPPRKKSLAQVNAKALVDNHTSQLSSETTAYPSKDCS